MVVVSDSGELNITGDLEATAGLRVSNNNRQKLRQRFDIIRKLGQGTYGKVQLALNKDSGEEVAIKTIKKAKIETEQDLIRIQREIQIMSSVRHPHIIHIYEVFENKEKIVLVMEYASGGEVYDYLSYKRALDDCDARRLFRQIVSAVYYCHKNKICHRDLKLENILLDEKGNAKIADFGLSNVFDEKNLLNTFCGSPLYASPEIVKGTPYYGPEVDCWSLGVLLYTLVYGAMPFDGSNFRRLVKQISEGDYYEPKQPSEASTLIRRMLTVVPSKRAAIEEVCTDWWVNLGYQDSLLNSAEEMCQAMPVRLDYLLQLVPPTIPPAEVSAEQSSLQTNKDNEHKPELKECSTVLAKNNLSLENVGDKAADVANNATTAKKHELSSSTKSVESDSTDKIGSIKKKKKKVMEKESSSLKESKETKPTNASVEEILTHERNQLLNLPQGETIGDTTKENFTKKSISVDKKNSPIENLEALITKSESKMTEQQNQEKQAVNSQVKGDKTAINQSTSVAEIKTPTGLVCTNNAEPMEVDTKPDIADGKKPTKTKDNNNSTSKNANESTSQLSARRGSKTIEEKKLLFSAPKVSEARKAFESKPTEKKSLVVPGLKVSVARKAFESSGSGGKASASKAASKASSLEKSKEPEASSSSNEKLSTDSSSSTIREGSSIAINKTEDILLPPVDKAPDTKKFESSIETTIVAMPDDSKVANKIQERKVSPSKECNLRSGQQNTTGFVPTLDVSMAVKPPKKSLGKPPAAPRTPCDSSGPSSCETTPETAKVTTSPLVKPINRRTSLGKTVAPLPENNIVPCGSSDGENEPKMSPSSSSKDICGSESSFLARAFMNKASADSTTTSGTEKPTLNLPTPSSPTNTAEKSLIETKPVKVSTVEIQLNATRGDIPSTTATIAATPAVTEPAPLKLPPKPGKFMLLGVKSEVSFAMDAPSEEVETVSAPLPSQPQRLQSLYMNVTLPPPPPATPSPEFEHPPQTSKFVSMKETVNADLADNRAQERVIPVQTDGDASDDSRQGYSVYRSKFHSTHSSRLSNLDSQRAPSLERSESLSSTGSTDDLEDIFDNLTSDSMLSGILNRTRNIIDELTRDSASRQFSSFFSGSGAGGLSGSSRMRSTRRDTFQDPFAKKDWFSDFTSGIGSSRFSKESSLLDSFLTRSRNVGSGSWRSTVNRMSPDADSYLSDSGSGVRTRRNRNSSNNRGTYDDDYTSDSGTRSSCSNRRSAFSTCSSRSTSNSISEEENLQSERKYVSRTNSLNESSSCSEASFYSRAYGAASRRDSGSSSTSSVASQRQSWNKTPTNSWQSGSSSRSTTTNNSQDKHAYGSSFAQSASDKLRDLVQNRRTTEGEFYQGHRSRSRGHDSTLDNFTALCGNIRRPRSLLRYTKSMTKDLSADEANDADDTFFSDIRRRRMHRPRSILVLADPDDDAKDEDDSSTSSEVSHERYRYPRDDISRGGGSASGRGNSRRDGSAGGSGSSGSRNNYSFISMTSKGSGYAMHDDASHVNDHSEHQKSPVDGTDKSSSSSVTDSGVYSASSDVTRPERKDLKEQTAKDQRRPSHKTSVGGVTSDEPLLNGLSNSQEITNGAASYWAKRYGSTSRNGLPNTNKNNSIDNASMTNGHDNSGKNSSVRDAAVRSYKYNEKWVGVNATKNDENVEVKKELPEDSLVGYARSVSVELDQLQNRLNQRFDRDCYQPSTLRSAGMSRSLARRLSLSDESSSSAAYLQHSTRDKINRELVSETNARENAKIENLKTRESYPTSSESDLIHSTDSTPTPTPTPTPAISSKETKKLETNSVQQVSNRATEQAPQDERSVSSENEDSCSDILESPASGRVSVFEEESVSERIRRKSYFARFQDSRLNRKHHDQHRKSLDINRNHHMTRHDDFSTLKSPLSLHSHTDYSRTGSLGRRNSYSHALANDDYLISQPAFKSAQDKGTRPCKNGLVHAGTLDYDNTTAELQNGLADHEVHSDFEENGNVADKNGLTRENSVLSIVANGHVDTESKPSSSSDKFTHAQRFTRHMSLLDNSVGKVPGKVNNANSTVHQDWYSCSSPLDASNQLRASSRNRHDYIINRALSTLDDRSGTSRPFSPPTRSSLTDHHVPDLRQFSAILDNASPRDLLRKALDVCNSLQY